MFFLILDSFPALFLTSAPFHQSIHQSTDPLVHHLSSMHYTADILHTTEGTTNQLSFSPQYNTHVVKQHRNVNDRTANKSQKLLS